VITFFVSIAAFAIGFIMGREVVYRDLKLREKEIRFPEDLE
jgi:hypothetical protein